MSKSGCLLGFTGATILKTILYVLNWTIKLIASVLLFFGLYIPFIYLIYGGLLYLIAKVPIFNFSTNSQLYLLGLLLCIICSVIISVRNLIMKPLTSIVAFYDKKNTPEQPLVYRSNVMRDLIIYEYKDRYDVYRDINGRLSFIRTEAKRKFHR